MNFETSHKEQAKSENEIEEISDDMIIEVRDISEEKNEEIISRENSELAELREKFSDSEKNISEKYGAGRFKPGERFRDFANEAVVNGRIELPATLLEEAQSKADEFREGTSYFTSTITGTKIAAEYDIRTNNFSTQTNIMQLEDGRKVFAVYAHGGSFVHRTLDGVMKKLSGLKMKKVKRSKWKESFEEKSNIPVIRNDDPNMVLMPFISNVNAYDVFANNHDITDFGENEWAGEAGVEDKLLLAEGMVDELKRVHDDGQVWGESILPNIILDKEKRPIICDPEIRYHNSVSNTEARARDLKDLILSVCGAIKKGENDEDYPKTVHRMLSRYKNDEVLDSLQGLAGQKRGLLQKLVFGYEQVRTGTESKEQYESILDAIKNFDI